MTFFDSQRREARNRGLWRIGYLLSTGVLLIGIGAVSALVGYLFETPVETLPRVFGVGVAVSAVVVLLSALTYPLARQPPALTALALGARPLSAGRDSERSRLLNVCAEMAISAGIPEPPLFLLEDEAAINALAIGRRPDETVIVVSAGAFSELDRDALQALLAWCFGRIRDGECAFDSELLSLHHGLLAPYRLCLAPLRWMLDRARRIPIGYTKLGVPVDARPIALMLGFPAVLGALVSALGFVLASLLQAAARRRGMLKSDAAVIELTRQREPLQRLLQALHSDYRRSRMTTRGLEDLGHFCFAPTAWLPPLFLESHPSPQRRQSQIGLDPLPPTPRAAPRPAPTARDGAAPPTALRGAAPIAQATLFPSSSGQRVRYRPEHDPPDPTLLARCAAPESAALLLAALFASSAKLSAAGLRALAEHHGLADADDAALPALLARCSPRQRIALIEATRPTLASWPAPRRDALRPALPANDGAALLHWTQWTVLTADAGKGNDAPVGIDVRSDEVRALLAWMLVRSGAAGAPGLALLQRHESALGLQPSARIPAPDPQLFERGIARLDDLDAELRARLFAILSELARHDRRLRDEEWLLLRGLAARWGLAAPD